MSERFKVPVLKTGDGATHRGFESHSLRQKSSTPAGVLLFGAEMGFERATQAQPGEKLSGGQFLARGRIPAFPNAVRRTVGGKANVMKPAPIRGRFFVNEEAGFERATQAQPGEKLSGGIFGKLGIHRQELATRDFLPDKA